MLGGRRIGIDEATGPVSARFAEVFEGRLVAPLPEIAGAWTSVAHAPA